ncbi:MAG TPA: glycosyltransferase 87 family protein, partial [Gaiellaceae bacterium]|nr:glycosyltransferase 87 family protein [Gaiellaceae bacterium]
MLGLLLGGAALAATAGLAASVLRLGSVPVFAIGCWILACAEVVAAGEILSLAHSLRPLGYALFEAGLLAAVLAVWLRAGRPRPPRIPLERRSGLVVAVLALIVLCGLGYELFLITGTAPNNWDSMHYHLARVAAWHAHHTLSYFPTQNQIENAYPQNAELLVLWTVVLLGRDLLAAVPQLLAALAATTSVYVIARRLGVARRPSAFSALLLPTLTIVALESVTTQNDLVEASFVAAAVALALGRTRAETALAGIALGLAAGTKLTFLYAIPPLVVIGLLCVPRRRLAELCAAAVAGFVLVGMYAYVQNLAETGRPQGKTPEVETLPPAITFGGTVSTVARTVYRMVDVGGFHVPTGVTSHVAGAAKRVFTGLHIPDNPAGSTTRGTFAFSYGPNTGVSEDSSALGPLGFLLLLPLSIGFVVVWIRKRVDRRRAAFALALPLYIVALAFGTRWNLYVDRFLVTPAALTLPLVPAVLRRIEVRLVVLALAAATLAVAFAYSPSKPTGAS